MLLNRCVDRAQLTRRDELLRQYYALLRDGGVEEYSWAQCRADYRLGVVEYLGVAIGYRRWQPWVARHLPPLLHEIDALAIDALLEGGS